MKLEVIKGFSGVEGSASVGAIIEVDEEKGKRMLRQGYPVQEVKDENKRTQNEPANNPKPSEARK